MYEGPPGSVAKRTQLTTRTSACCAAESRLCRHKASCAFSSSFSCTLIARRRVLQYTTCETAAI